MTGRLRAWVSIAAFVVSACSRPGTSIGSVELTVLGAASLRDVLEVVEPAYERATRGVEIVLAAGSSAALRAQIEAGAPADVFLAADAREPQALVDAGLADGAPVPFAANTLAIVVPAGNPARIAGPADLGRPGLRVIAAGEAVPITAYATEVIARLAALDGVRDDLPSAYAANVVSREDDVRAVLTKIVLGEGDAALVYATDAIATEAVTTIPLPAGANVVVTYAGVVVGSSAQLQAAQAFLAWLISPDGQSPFAAAGFGPVP